MVDAYSTYQFAILLALVFHVSLQPNVRAVELNEFLLTAIRIKYFINTKKRNSRLYYGSEIFTRFKYRNH